MNLNISNLYIQKYTPASPLTQAQSAKNMTLVDNTSHFISFKGTEALRCKNFPLVSSPEEASCMLVKALGVRDSYTAKHSQAVAVYSTALAEEYAKRTKMQNAKEFVNRVKLAAELHDIGKLSFPDNLFSNKEPKMKELATIKKHPVISAEILNTNPKYSKIADICKHHHEHWDGKGYPDRIAGEQIPLESRIIAIADSFDAMTSNRAYEENKSCKEAITELTAQQNIQFDPKLTEIFVEIASKSYQTVHKQIYKN